MLVAAIMRGLLSDRCDASVFLVASSRSIPRPKKCPVPGIAFTHGNGEDGALCRRSVRPRYDWFRDELICA